MRGEIANVVGVDIPFPEPDNPELVFDNDIDRLEFKEVIDEIMNIDSVRNAWRTREFKMVFIPL